MQILKKVKNASCKEFASECHNGIHLCKKHYHAHITSASETPPLETPPLETPDTTHICGVILRYGKIKEKCVQIQLHVAYI